MIRALWLLVFFLASCNLPFFNRTPPPSEPERMVIEAEALGQAGVYSAAARGFEEVVKRFPAAPVHDRALYGLARILVLSDNSARDYRQAHAYFERLLREHPSSPYVPDARAWRSLIAAYLSRSEELDRLKQIDIEMERRRRR